MSEAINVSEFTVHMLSSRVDHLEQRIAKLQQAIMENAYVGSGDAKVMAGWARQALGEELPDSVQTPKTDSIFFDPW